MTQTRHGFTMIELIFAIVIIGILSAVAVPKLVTNRDNALAKICVTESSRFILEMTAYYTRYGAWDPIEKVTNLQLGVILTPGNGKHGLTIPSTTVPLNDISIVYACNGEAILSLTPQNRLFVDNRGVSHNEYELDVQSPVLPSTQPASIAQANLLANGIYKTNPGYRIGGN